MHVITSDQMTKVRNFSFLYCWGYVKVIICHSCNSLVVVLYFQNIITRDQSENGIKYILEKDMINSI